MRNKKWDLIIGVIAVLILIGNFVEGNSTTHLIGFEINSWIYRGIWLLIGITNLSQYFIRRKKEGSN